MKATFKPGNNHTLQFGWRHTENTFGDIFPSHVAHNTPYHFWVFAGKQLLP